MNFKHNTSEPNQDLKGGNINKKNIDIFKNVIIESDASKSNNNEVVGYRTLTGGAKKVKKNSKNKNLKKNSKNKKYSKQSREKLNGHQDLSETEYEETENIDSYGEEDEEDEMAELSGIDDSDDENKKQKKEMKKEDEKEDNEMSSNISPDTENQNESLVSEGDDDNETVPIDSEEMGTNYKEIIKKLMKENKNLKRTTMKKSSKSKKSSKLSKSKKSNKSNKSNMNDSSSLSLEDLEEEFGNKNEPNKESGLFNQIFQNPAHQQAHQQAQGMQGMQASTQFNPNSIAQQFQSMQPTNEYASNSNQQFNQGFSSNGIYKMKQGSNNNFNEILGGLNQEGLIPVLPEMQQYFNMDQIAQMPQTGPQPDYQFGMSSQPQIMDPGLLNNSMKRQLPLVSDPSLANMSNLGSANSFGTMGSIGSIGSMGEFGKDTKNVESNSVPTPINEPAPTNTNTNTNASNEPNIANPPNAINAVQIDGATNAEADNGVLNGGGLKKKKNFFLMKK